MRLAAVALLALAGCTAPVRRAVLLPPSGAITVAADGQGQFTTINAAIAAARDGSVIYVYPGVYREQVRIADRRGLTIIGADPVTTIVDAAGRYAAVEIRTDSNSIANLTLRGADDHGIWVRDGAQSISYCLVVGCGDRGIYLSALAGNAFARIEHCTIVENGTSGIYAARDDARTVIRHCIIAHNPRGIVTDGSDGKLVIENNCLFNSEADFDRATPGADNIVVDPQFSDRDAGDYDLARSSPCRGRAPNGRNLGYLP
jgi:nitrous oxidase accessory protein NosD